MLRFRSRKSRLFSICVTSRSILSSFFFIDTATTEIYTLSLHDAFRSVRTSAIALCLRRCGCRCRWCCAASWWCHARGLLERHPHAVALERTRRRKFPQLVPDHLLGHIHGNEFLPVVHGDSMPDHFRHDRPA